MNECDYSDTDSKLLQGHCTNRISHYAHDTRNRNRRRKPIPENSIKNRHENRARPIRYHKLIPETFGAKLHFRRVRNRYPFPGTSF